MAKKTDQPTIEQQLKRLEEIAMLLDAGDAPLDEQLRSYEEGMALAKQCREYLAAAELRITSISGDDASV
ncbi:MAG: exodeoxyribonuclease VII small subunit [Bacteroidetes bacterium]|nr:exodeoxyribonuclease VII small subunit [Bacteroidota bacterium]